VMVTMLTSGRAVVGDAPTSAEIGQLRRCLAGGSVRTFAVRRCRIRPAAHAETKREGRRRTQRWFAVMLPPHHN